MRTTDDDGHALSGPSVDRVIAAVRDALDECREPRPDWRDAVSDVLTDTLRILRREDSDPAQLADLIVHDLLGIWLSPAEVDDVYVGESPLGPPLSVGWRPK